MLNFCAVGTGEGYARAMTWHACRRGLSHAVVAAGLFACAAPAALADEAAYCVTCTNPDQTYVCRVSAGGAKPSDALKLYCVIRTAKEGHHSSCSAERNSPTCNGVEKVYSYDGPMPADIAADPHVKHYTDKIKQEQQAFEKPKGDAPKTLVELTGRAVSASRQGLRNARSAIGSSPSNDQSLTGEPLPLNQSPAPLVAGNSSDGSLDAPHPSKVQRAGTAVGGFARKSYRCVLSLFRNCSDQTADGDMPR
jgi:hypothetical protein